MNRRRGPGTWARRSESLRFAVTRDRQAWLRFFTHPFPVELSSSRRLALARKVLQVTQTVRGYHAEAEILAVGEAILCRSGRGPHVVEAGCAHGSSTAKLSWFVAEAGGRLTVLDSFRGIPENDEVHQTLDGRVARFRKGAFRGRFATVQRTLARVGVPRVCTLLKGDFEDTAPDVRGPIDVLLLDVDLIRSTRTCLKALHPKVRSGGVVFSQDGHLRATVQLLSDPTFWHDIGSTVPRIPELGTRKFIRWLHP
ncbi:MAG TPA: class I SAM-dependent methyltransferase [Myxococcales bacterium LLY-WYZ-16_1]|jgi:hypothetical protein|nr:class I SAM-dependent methyltransferase [Myxococcales bacterium LLY-WYZ-16_1]